MKSILTATLAFALAMNASAAPMFDQIHDSNRVERIMYTDSGVVKVGAIINQPFFIEFNHDEKLDDVAGGAIAGWEVVKKDFRIFVRAKPEAKPGTLLVTSRTRSYVFDLVPMKSTPANYENRRSKIVFSYGPTPEQLAAQAAARAAANQPAEPPLLPPVIYKNENYTMQVVSQTVDIKPREVHDDGRFTYFKFPKNLEIPAIYRSVPKTKEEILVNSHREGDFIVMHGVAPLWNLRLAGSVVGVFNESYDTEGVAPVNGTTVHGLSRNNK